MPCWPYTYILLDALLMHSPVRIFKLHPPCSRVSICDHVSVCAICRSNCRPTSPKIRTVILSWQIAHMSLFSCGWRYLLNIPIISNNLNKNEIYNSIARTIISIIVSNIYEWAQNHRCRAHCECVHMWREDTTSAASPQVPHIPEALFSDCVRLARVVVGAHSSYSADQVIGSAFGFFKPSVCRLWLVQLDPLSSILV